MATELIVMIFLCYFLEGSALMLSYSSVLLFSIYNSATLSYLGLMHHVILSALNVWVVSIGIRAAFLEGLSLLCELRNPRYRMPPRPVNRRGGSPPPQNPLSALEQANANMMAGITALLEQQAARPKLSHDEDVAERFQKKGHKEFACATDPLIAEGWIRSLESIFAYMGLTDADKVRCAVYMLKGDADLWWESASRGVNLTTLRWTDFQRMFFSKYFIEDVRSSMIRDFMSLRQGDKIVVEYIRQFERGCHLVPLIADSAPEKMRQFIEGLRAEIKHDVCMADVPTYEAAVSRALRSEEGRREIQREQQSKRQFQSGYQRPSSQPPAKKQCTGPSKGPNQQKPQQQRQQPRGGAPNAGGYPTCPKCQKMHPGPCHLGAGVCFHCKEPGHQMANCPRKNTTGRVFVMQAEEEDPDTSLITVQVSA
ncbi:uncharacterized protein [Henckelia pumila]|uniref:uncharacterized protein isoform X4 n=1 Tax=Henckelia pumila TaxID=405737 RepID=UPI003C6DFDA0